MVNTTDTMVKIKSPNRRRVVVDSRGESPVTAIGNGAVPNDMESVGRKYSRGGTKKEHQLTVVHGIGEY